MKIGVLKIVHDRNSTFGSAILTVIGEAMFGWNRETSLTLEQQQDSSDCIFTWERSIDSTLFEMKMSMQLDQNVAEVCIVTSLMN